MKILITGGCGFIGSNLVHLALSRGHSVVNYDKLTYAGNARSLDDVSGLPAYRFVHGDICNRELLSYTLTLHRPDAVMNLAAESHVDRSIDAPDDFIRTNFEGTAAVLEASRAYMHEITPEEGERFRVLHVSTDEVFGSLGPEGMFDETTPYDPSSPYSASKAASDHIVRAWHRTYGLPTIVTNCSNNYGPYQFPEKLIPHMITSALAGRRLPVYGDGSNVRDWIYVADHASALLAALERGRPGETYAIGAASERTNLEIVEHICGMLDELRPRAGGSYAEQIEFVTDRPGHDKRYAIDASKARRELGWAPSRSFEQGMRETVEWYLENTAWTDGILSGGYRLERAGLAS